VQSDTVAQGYGSLGLMTRADDAGWQDGGGRGRARHGDAHYREHQKGKETSTNSIASIFAWTQGLSHRAKLDSNENWQIRQDAGKSLRRYVEAGYMTKDLALLVGADQRWLSTTGSSTRSRKTSPRR